MHVRNLIESAGISELRAMGPDFKCAPPLDVRKRKGSKTGGNGARGGELGATELSGVSADNKLCTSA